jgi:putative thioredoxin
MSHEVTDFESEVIEKSRQVPVVVDFWAPWCGPCRALGPVLERLAVEAGGRWVLAKVNTEEHQELAAEYGIQSIPNVKLFADGEVVDEFLGALPEREVRRWLEQALPSPYADAVARAREMLTLGQFAEAAATLRAIVAEEPALHGARLALAETLLHTDPAAVPAALAGLEIEADEADRVEALRQLAERSQLLERPAGLPEAPVKARYLEALRAVRVGDWDTALEACIEVMRTQRGYADGAAQETGRAIFVLLGWQHPICEKHHRAFASARNV